MFDKTKYQRDYRKNKLKRVPLDIPIEKYEQIKEYASSHSETINGFIKRAIDETMERENTTTP